MGKQVDDLEVVADLHKMEEENPDAAHIFGFTGTMFSTLDLHEEALAFTGVLDLQPEEGDSLIGKGVALAGLGREEDALDALNRGLVLQPNDTRGVHQRALIHAEAGRHEEALADFTKAGELDESDSGYQLNRVISLYNLDRNEEALDVINKVLESEPNFAGAQEWKARILSVSVAGRRRSARCGSWSPSIQTAPTPTEIWGPRWRSPTKSKRPCRSFGSQPSSTPLSLGSRPTRDAPFSDSTRV